MELLNFTDFSNKVARNLKVVISPTSFFTYPKDLHQHHILSYSQEGEDRVLARYFEDKNDGFYIDVGAHHPQRFSNTYYFYLRGWCGINIDAMPGCMEIFNKIRSKDINLEVAISNIEQELKYYEFNEPALNGFSRGLSEERDKLENYQIIATHIIKTRQISQILDEYLPVNREIDFLSVDVEGLDLEVLQSNNWDKYRPKLVLAESLSTKSVEDLLGSEICRYMTSKGYYLHSKLCNTTIFSRLDE
jgi:FkbM family methyltransferase